jgi:hypothetical protein
MEALDTGFDAAADDASTKAADEGAALARCRNW